MKGGRPLCNASDFCCYMPFGNWEILVRLSVRCTPPLLKGFLHVGQRRVVTIHKHISVLRFLLQKVPQVLQSVLSRMLWFAYFMYGAMGFLLICQGMCFLTINSPIQICIRGKNRLLDDQNM